MWECFCNLLYIWQLEWRHDKLIVAIFYSIINEVYFSKEQTGNILKVFSSS